MWGVTDDALVMEVLASDVLEPQNFNLTRMYEKQSPDSCYIPDTLPALPLNEANVVSQWTGNQFGLVEASGHGSANGIVRVAWTNDWVPDCIVENPTDPKATGGKSKWELSEPWFLHRSDALPSPGGTAPVLVAMSCDTGDASQPDNLPMTLLTNGQISAWTGGAAAVSGQPGWSKPSDEGAETIGYDITTRLIGKGQAIGQAVWEGLNDYWTTLHDEDWGFIDWDLYGDPSMTYFGNGADTSGAWPMFHHDWPGTGETDLTGPAQAALAWSEPIAAVKANATTPSPVVWEGGIVIADPSGKVSEYGNVGNLVWSYRAGNGPIDNAPAIAISGTVYVKSGDGMLYRIDQGGIAWKQNVGRATARRRSRVTARSMWAVRPAAASTSTPASPTAPWLARSRSMRPSPPRRPSIQPATSGSARPTARSTPCLTT